MTTATQTTKTGKTQQRTMQFLVSLRLLFITEGRKVSSYFLEPLDTPNAYQLTKNDGTVYNVLLAGSDSLCDCKGFEHRGMQTKDGKGCKHVASLTALQQLGKL
ncbi:MAG: hypothetical protein ACRELF_13040 [Gemmataceae bacterium]